MTPQTYIRAEVDLTCAQFQLNAGSDVSRFYFIRKPTPLDAQAAVRMKRDTLYAGAVVDTEDDATTTIPELPDDRYFSILVIDDHFYAQVVFSEPGT